MYSSKASAKCLTPYLLGCTCTKTYTHKAQLQEFLKSLHPAEGCNPRGISSCENYYLLHPADYPMVQPHVDDCGVVEPLERHFSRIVKTTRTSVAGTGSQMCFFLRVLTSAYQGAKFRRRAFLYPVKSRLRLLRTFAGVLRCPPGKN